MLTGVHAQEAVDQLGHPLHGLLHQPRHALRLRHDLARLLGSARPMLEGMRMETSARTSPASRTRSWLTESRCGAAASAPSLSPSLETSPSPRPTVLSSWLMFTALLHLQNTGGRSALRSSSSLCTTMSHSTGH